MRTSWQLPSGGLTTEQLRGFEAKIDRDAQPGHFIWRGTCPPAIGPQFQLDTGLVSATRIAWAIYGPPGERLVPLRLFRKKDRCDIQRCINPACFYGRVPNCSTDVKEDGTIRLPRTLEALAHMQFGHEPTPRPFRGVVERPAVPRTYEPPRAISALELIELLSAPCTSWVTYPSGSVHFYSSTIRVDGDNVEDVLRKIHAALYSVSEKSS